LVSIGRRGGVEENNAATSMRAFWVGNAAAIIPVLLGVRLTQPTGEQRTLQMLGIQEQRNGKHA
jgi:hypothetical protein